MCTDWVSKVHVDKTARCLSVWGQKKPADIKLQYFCQYGDQNKKNQQQPKNNVKHIYFRHYTYRIRIDHKV
jgi:hypothetical protein